METVKQHIITFRKEVEKARLTKSSIAHLETPPTTNGKPSVRWLYCDRTPRLAVCVRSTGTKAWYWIGRFDGRMLRYKLGGFPEVTPEQARQMAMGVSAQAASGEDPRADRRKERTGDTLLQLFDRYLAQVSKPHKRTWAQDRQIFDCYCKPLRSRRAGSLTRDDIRGFHVRLGSKVPISANRVLSLLMAVFDFGNIEPNPAKGVKRFPETERERFLSPSELPRFLDALRYERPRYQDYFTLLLFTGCRSANLAQMRWRELDLDSAVWTVPGEKFKNGKPAQIYLCQAALEILRRRKAEAKGEWVFPGRPGNKVPYMRRPTKPWERVCERAELEDITPHDLRRSLGSWAAAGGESLLTIGKILGHADLSSTQIYARLSLDSVKSAVDKTVSTMLAANGKGPDDE